MDITYSLSYNSRMKLAPPTTIRAADARNNFAEILGRAYFAGETFLIEKQGKPYAVVIGIDEYRRLVGSASAELATPDEQQPEGADGSSLASR